MAENIFVGPEGIESLSELSTKTQDGKDLYIGAGWVLFGLKGLAGTGWNYRDLVFDVGPQWQDPPASRVEGKAVTVVVSTVSLASVMNNAGGDHAGWAIDDCIVERTQSQDLSYYRTRIVCKIGTRDSHAWLYRVNYHIAMLGRRHA